MEVVTQFRTTDKLGDLDVLSLAAANGNIYVGTPTGLFMCLSSADTCSTVSLQGTGPILDLALFQTTKIHHRRHSPL